VRKLDGVSHNISKDLLEADAVPAHRAASVRQIQIDPQMLFFGFASEAFTNLPKNNRKIQHSGTD
jgi:hypothetical protein